MKRPRTVVFLGSSKKDFQDFPEAARHDLGHELWAVQNDREPKDWKPMPSVGPGVRGASDTGSERCLSRNLCRKIADKVHVLHAFQKKTQTDRAKGLDLAKRRYREVI